MNEDTRGKGRPFNTVSADRAAKPIENDVHGNGKVATGLRPFPPSFSSIATGVNRTFRQHQMARANHLGIDIKVFQGIRKRIVGLAAAATAATAAAHIVKPKHQV